MNYFGSFSIRPLRNFQGETEDTIEVEPIDDITLEGPYDECSIESGEAFASTAWLYQYTLL